MVWEELVDATEMLAGKILNPFNFFFEFYRAGNSLRVSSSGKKVLPG